MGIYTTKDLLKLFSSAYQKNSPKKLDIGKSCSGFKKPEDIPYDLIASLVSKITPQEWIHTYEDISNKNENRFNFLLLE